MPDYQPLLQRFPAPMKKWYQQSTPIPSSDPVTEVLTQETVTFEDAAPGIVETMAPGNTELAMEDQVASADLADFLARPVKIATITWNESTAAGTTLLSMLPWQRFFNETRIKFKLNNFAFMRAKLKVKVMVNASPFYYGLAGAFYQPLPTFTPSTITNDGSNRYLIPLSQRPHVWISPQDNEAGVLELPFFNQKNWLDITRSADFAEMGRLEFTTFTDLDSANGVTGTGVTIQVYAWAEDVHLSGATLSLALQSQPKDEYGDGPISRPAAALAKAAGALVPVFGKFATATQMALKTSADVAKLFGYTNVPVIDPPHSVRVEQFANFASADIGYPVKKLTLDPKAELAVDTSVVGLDGKDELAIAHIVQKESYLFQTRWSTSQPPDLMLAYNQVTPQLFDRGTSGTTPPYNLIYYTPMAHLAEMYAAWRGDLIFRFKFVATPYHKGRVIITYDPLGDATNNVTTVPDGTTGAFSVIVDLAEANEVEMRIPYQQALPWLQTQDVVSASIPFSTSTGPTFVKNVLRFNGAWQMRVLTTLTAPVLTNGIPVMVFVRGADNLEFNNPTSLRQNLSPFVPQSTPVELGSQPTATSNLRGLMHYGEVQRSVRPLLRRTHYVGPATWINVTAGQQRYGLRHFKIPPYPGFDSTGWYTVTRPIAGGTGNYNWASMTPIQWMSLPFVTYRGSTIWHYQPLTAGSTGQTPSFRVTRSPANTSDTGLVTVSSTLSASVNSRNALSTFGRSNSAGGILMNPRIQAGEGVLLPNNTQYLMQSTNPSCATTVSAGTTVDGHETDCIEVDIDVPSAFSTNSSTNWSNLMQLYCGVGTDFNLLWYLNAPVIYYTNTIPTPV